MTYENLKPRDIFWNTLGMCSYAIVSLFLSVIIVSIAGGVEGGIFSFGFSTLARLVFIVTFFGIRPLHIVDIKYRYTFLDYRNFGIRLGVVSLILGFTYVILRYCTGIYDLKKSFILMLLIVHGAIDGFSDYYECEYQRVNRLYMSGISQFLRIVIFAFTLAIILLLTKELLLALVIALLLELLTFYILNIKYSNAYFDRNTINNNGKKLFYEALPLFLITFLDTFVFSMSKIYIDVELGDTYSGFYGIVFMPTNAVYLLMTLFMKPMLTPLANSYYRDKKEYNLILRKSLYVAFAIATISIVGAFIFGKFYLDIIAYFTNNSYSEFESLSRQILVILMIGGSFYTVTTPYYFSLIIENKRVHILVVYIIVSILSIFIVRYFIKTYGIMGASYGFVASMSLIFLGIVIAKFVGLVIKDE